MYKMFSHPENTEPVLWCDTCNGPAVPNSYKQVEYRHAAAAGCKHTGSPCLQLCGPSCPACHVVCLQNAL